MKVQIFLCVIYLCTSSSFLGYTATIGESCQKDSTFKISNFAVAPYPPQSSEQYIITIQGTFSSKEYVNQIYIGQRYNKGSWHNTYQDVNGEFSKGSNETFTISLQAPSVKGPYTDQITFHRSDFSYIACWQFDFSI